MSVFILTEGGKTAGFGHITRCISIYQAFEEAGIRSELIVNGDETIPDFVKGRNCRIFDWLNSREALFSALRDADIVFVDSYLADYNLYENISKTAKTAVYFDDNIRMNYPEGFVVNGAIFAEQMSYPERKGVTYLLGAQYAPLRKEFWDVPVKPIHDVLKTVMITFGGTDIRDFTPKVLKLLVDTYPGLVKKVIIGKGFRNTTEIETLKDRNTELVYYPDAAGIKKVMLESDIAISSSGQTLYELGRIGVPTIMIIVVPVPDNLMKSFRSMEKLGIIEYAGSWQDNCLAEKIKGRIERLNCRKVRQNESSRLREVFDGESALRLVRRIIK